METIRVAELLQWTNNVTQFYHHCAPISCNTHNISFEVDSKLQELSTNDIFALFREKYSRYSSQAKIPHLGTAMNINVQRGEEHAILRLYVDDLIIAGTSKEINDILASEIEKYVTLTEKKDSEPFIGIEIKREEDGFYLSQTHYIDTILHRFGLEECNSVQTPGDQNQNLDEYLDSKPVDKTVYQEMIGSLMYLSTGTRPDISFNVSNLSQYSSDNKESIYIDGKEIKMTIDTGSDTTFIGLENLKNIFPKSQMPTLNGTERKFYAYGQTSPLPCCGYFFADVSWGERSIKEQIFVIEGKAEPILGKKASFELEIIKRGTKIRNIQQEVIPKDIYNLIQENMNLFQGQGNVKGYSQKITLKENVTPVAQRCRHFPYKMVEAINQELDKMIEDGIIEEVHEASEWISNIVAVPKKVAFYFQTSSRVLIIPNCMLQLPLKRLRFNQSSPFKSNNKKPRNDIVTERLSRQDKEMELNQDPIGVKSDGPTETMERRQEVRESEPTGERQEVTGRETTAPLADAVKQLSTLLTRVKISDGAESAIPPFDGAYSATQFFQTFDRKMEDASMGEQEKLLRLPNYLVRQPLELFRKLRLADRSYFQVRQILLDLYPESSEASFAKYFAMKLTGQANLETYYREKNRHGIATRTSTRGDPRDADRRTAIQRPAPSPRSTSREPRRMVPTGTADPRAQCTDNATQRRSTTHNVGSVPQHTPTPRCMECTSSTIQLQVLRRETLAQRMPTSTSPDDPRKSADGANSPKTTNHDSTTTKSSQGHPSRAALSRLRTISRRLVANGLHSCRPLRRLPLTPPNRRQRLEWCRARSTWMTEWHRVVFSDESRFCLSSDSRRVRVWRRRGERSNPAAIVERPTVRQRGIMVWGAIAYDSRSPLLRIQGTMTAQRYVDDVLRPVTLPYLQGVPNALYQQDNARPHTARISQQALQDVQMLPWPPYSPDLSPIEHVWDIIGRRLHALPQPRSEDELWQMVEREWRAIPQDAIRTLIDSLPRRVAACIAVRGGPTCY
ncbi:hypothetical protein LAZ67_10000699 [Cordylochernes scorpioides]|uniref:Uncharacterized protein n=1 Tax=Cordylochernes scorpioides TaxID=51811 RepID=A0ABY6KVU1_9ARAC|nr:hypothetical protein LAZ67_10000699 [Cordylochernes scorpioides]